MPSTAHQDFTYNGGQFAVILPVTLGTGADSGKITAVGTAIKHEALISSEFKIAMGSASKTEVISVQLESGRSVEIPKITTVIDGATGSEKASSSSDASDSITINSAESSVDALKEIQALKNKTVFIAIANGRTNSGAIDGLVFLHGRVSGEIAKKNEGNKAGEISITITGESATAATAFTEAALNSAFTTTVWPLGEAADLDILKASPTTNHLSSADLTELLAGMIVLKDPS